MKKKKPVHPKLFINIDIDKMTIFFKQNKFNHKGDRLIEEELLESKIKINDIPFFLFKKNKEQLFILEKYIKVQKKVLDKHEKARNYDAYKIVKYSISKMNEFKENFYNWFISNTL